MLQSNYMFGKSESSLSVQTADVLTDKDRMKINI